ncbi:hypothetical protein [Chitinimonas sp. PSY-7]|uniref:hypothetical protein n=1 Tax=Chitinimonas sp. PSY-7 TaxID=3459088 RepID=UPI00403FF79C
MPYRIGKFLEPDGFEKLTVRNQRYHTQKWNAYPEGRRAPRAQLINLVDSQLPGSAWLINHVVWDAIEGGRSVNALIRRGRDEFPFDLMSLTVELGWTQWGAEHIPYPDWLAKLKSAECAADLNMLACLTILVRQLCKKRDWIRAGHAAESLYRTLLIVCLSEPFRQFSVELYDAYKATVFPLLKRRKWNLDFTGVDFEERVELLEYLLDQILGDSLSLVAGTRANRIAVELIRHHYRDDFML